MIDIIIMICKGRSLFAPKRYYDLFTKLQSLYYDRV